MGLDRTENGSVVVKGRGGVDLFDESTVRYFGKQLSSHLAMHYNERDTVLIIEVGKQALDTPEVGYHNIRIAVIPLKRAFVTRGAQDRLTEKCAHIRAILLCRKELSSVLEECARENRFA